MFSGLDFGTRFNGLFNNRFNNRFNRRVGRRRGGPADRQHFALHAQGVGTAAQRVAQIIAATLASNLFDPVAQISDGRFGEGQQGFVSLRLGVA